MGGDTLGSSKILHDAQEVLRLDERERPSTVVLGGQLVRDLPPKAREHASEQPPVGATREERRYVAGPPRVRNRLEVLLITVIVLLITVI